MIQLERPFRYARPDDAAALAELINFAGEGLLLYLWTNMAEPRESAWEAGRRRALPRLAAIAAAAAPPAGGRAADRVERDLGP